MKKTNATATILGGLAAGLAGAALMYIFDPASGKRRRAMARDQAIAANRKTREAIAGKAKDLRNRAEGLAARLRETNGDESERSDAQPVEM
jgi:gas vesicle protein